MSGNTRRNLKNPDLRSVVGSTEAGGNKLSDILRRWNCVPPVKKAKASTGRVVAAQRCTRTQSELFLCLQGPMSRKGEMTHTVTKTQQLILHTHSAAMWFCMKFWPENSGMGKIVVWENSDTSFTLTVSRSHSHGKSSILVVKNHQRSGFSTAMLLKTGPGIRHFQVHREIYVEVTASLTAVRPFHLNGIGFFMFWVCFGPISIEDGLLPKVMSYSWSP